MLRTLAEIVKAPIDGGILTYSANDVAVSSYHTLYNKHTDCPLENGTLITFISKGTNNPKVQFAIKGSMFYYRCSYGSTTYGSWNQLSNV